MQTEHFCKIYHTLRRFSMKYLWLAVLLVSLLVPPGAPIGRTAPPEQKPDGARATEQETFPTNEWAVQLVPGADPDGVAAQYGFENLGQVGTLVDIYLFRRPPAHVKDADPERLRAAPEVVWLEQQIARQQHKRIIPTDPLYADQWHLNNTGQSGGTAGQDINIVPVWNNNIMGTGVVIGIVDDGLQHTHPDLSPNYVPDASWDFNSGDADPSPSAGDGHGTSAGGVAAARDNTTCGVGSAFRAGLSGLRLIAAPSTDADEASALTYQYNTNDIFSNSWGPFDDGARLEGPGTLTLAALQDGVTNGRGGLGNVYIWAAGNGLENNDNVNYDGYANSRFTIAVGAVDHDGVQSYYSEPGAAMLVTAPSSGDGVGVTSTDLLGADGHDPGDCTSDFGGTSSATPLVSGVIALMLEANPNLTWRDVQHILVETAVQNDPGDSDWTTNGAGLLINHKYGFGRIDAAAAVNTASSWANVEPAVSVDSGVINVNQSIPDNDPTGVTSTFVVSDNITLEHVEVIFEATHTYRGDLEIVLTSPSGTQSILAEQHFEDFNNDYSNWQFMTVRNWGESSQGTWSLKIADRADLDTGTFNSWRLILHGTTGSPVDVYLIVDLTGSFADDLPVFKAQAPGIISALKASNPNTRFGLGKFEDYPIDPFGSADHGDKAYERLVDLTFDTDLVLNTIDGLFTRWGKDIPESQLPALYQAATGAGQDLSGVGYPVASIPPGQQANFRPEAIKLILLWTDAPFHRPGDPGDIPYPGPSFSETVNAILALEGTKVVGIFASGLTSTSASQGGLQSSSGTLEIAAFDGLSDLKTIAAATGGLAPADGVDCDGDGTIDLAPGQPLVCSIGPSGEGIGEAIIALVEAGTKPAVFTIHLPIVLKNYP